MVLKVCATYFIVSMSVHMGVQVPTEAKGGYMSLSIPRSAQVL